MLKRRLIPKLLFKAGTTGPVLVTTRQFSKVVEIGDPISQAKIYEAQVTDELIFLDIDATPQSRLAMLDVVRRAAACAFMPITIGGGVRSLDDFRALLTHGADKVALTTAALENPDLVRAASAAFGAQCVVAGIDYRILPDGTPRVFSHCGRRPTEHTPLTWARKLEELGAGEILLTNIDRDGTGEGLDLETARQIIQAVSIPVILSGGCGLARHFSEGFTQAGADAVAAGTFFCFKDQNPMQTRAHIRNAGVPIRVQT